MNPPWMDERPGFVEFNPGDLPCQVNVSANQAVIIDKLYGPLVAHSVRVRLEYRGDVADWVIESEHVVQGPSANGSDDSTAWIERARFGCEGT